MPWGETSIMPILDKINETSGPPLPPFQWCQNGGFCFRAFIIPLGGGRMGGDNRGSIEGEREDREGGKGHQEEMERYRAISPFFGVGPALIFHYHHVFFLLFNTCHFCAVYSLGLCFAVHIF